MEKIVVIINARKPNIGSIDFACQLAAMAQTTITGLFIENLYFEYVPTVSAAENSYFAAPAATADVKVTTDTDHAVRLFHEQCQRNGILPEVYIDRGEPIQETIYESRFADLFIIDPDIGFYDREEPLPSHFVKEILARAECPVLLTPEKFASIDQIVFCYDGSPSSVFAIKQFTYLLPELHDRKVLLLEVNRSAQQEFNQGHRRMMDWLRAHYSTVQYHSLKGDVKEELFTYFFMKEKMMVVIGAYGRSMLSNFFKKSNADVLIRMIDLPIFITHH